MIEYTVCTTGLSITKLQCPCFMFLLRLEIRLFLLCNLISFPSKLPLSKCRTKKALRTHTKTDNGRQKENIGSCIIIRRLFLPHHQTVISSSVATPFDIRTYCTDEGFSKIPGIGSVSQTCDQSYDSVPLWSLISYFKC